MFTRTTGLLIVPAWLAAMGWLIARDVWPRWTALEAPAVRIEHLLAMGRHAQYTLLLEGTEIGTIWTSYLLDERSIRRDDLIWIEHFPLAIAPLRIVASSVFTTDGALDEFDARIENPNTILPIRLHGERFHADFSFSFESGPLIRTFKVPLIEGSLITGAFSPFAEFRGVQVGQTWRMQVFNPVAALTNLGSRLIPVLVEVTGEERIRAGHWEGNCLVVEAGSTKSWIGAGGEVRAQEISLPMVGTVRIEREHEFDGDRRNTIRCISLHQKGARFDE